MDKGPGSDGNRGMMLDVLSRRGLACRGQR